MRLRDLDPQTFARELVERVQGHYTTRLMFDLDPDVRIEWRRVGWQGTNLGLAALVLCHYAKTGEAPEDAPIAEYLQSYCDALYTRPADAGMYEVPVVDQVEGDVVEDHDRVLVAAVARDHIAHRRAVSLRELAVLSEAGESPVSYARARNLASSGEIVTNGARGRGARNVEAKDAKRWLGARGVPGFRPTVVNIRDLVGMPCCPTCGHHCPDCDPAGDGSPREGRRHWMSPCHYCLHDPACPAVPCETCGVRSSCDGSEVAS